MESPPFHSEQPNLFALQPLLEGLAILHEWIAISNDEGQTLWTSDGQLANDVLAGRMAGPDLIEVLPIRQDDRARSDLRARLATIHREIVKGSEVTSPLIRIGRRSSGDATEMGLRIFRTSGSGGRAVFIAVADPLTPDSEQGPEQVIQELKARNQELENDLHSIFHSLRSSLVSLLGFSRLLKDDYSSAVGEEGSLFIRRIEEAGSGLNSKMDVALELSQIHVEAGERVPVDPTRVLMQIKAEEKLELERAGVTLKIAPDMPLVHCQPKHLYDILFHLVMNATQHMGSCEDRRIEVSVSTHEREHQIEVRDHGEGIKPQELESIFEIFRSNAASDRKRATQGVGLAMVRKIAQAHGGNAWAENASDQGAHFRVSLPFGE